MFFVFLQNNIKPFLIYPHISFTMDRNLAEYILKRVFGIEHFYDEQWEAISRIMNGERILMVERTGFGKSLCYQFPAIQFPGVTVVFSPLIALMRDQVNNLVKKGISAAYINSEQSPEENENVLERALKGEIKILYIAPERQEDARWMEAALQMKLSMIVIDEAHTISTWGHDFRPAFRRIVNLVRMLPVHLPVLATTATATLRVQADIEKQIGGKLTKIRGSLVRPNFKLYVVKVQSEDEKMLWLAQNLNKLPGTGLVYSGTRVDTETYTKWLKCVGINAVEYNAGLEADDRKGIEQGLMENKWKCIVSTNALGMGVDKSDIRFVIHTQMPVSPVHYYQEIGRAGRDGKPSIIILFYNQSKASDGTDMDMHLPLSFIDGARPSEKKYRMVIQALKNEFLSEKELKIKCNLKATQIRTIKYDLIDQHIIKEVQDGSVKRYEYQYDAPEFNYTQYEQLREAKLKELECMRNYVFTSAPRMRYLCSFLDSEDGCSDTNCDNTDLPKIISRPDPYLLTKLQEFRESNFPELTLSEAIHRYITLPDKPKLSLSLKIPYPDVFEIYKKQELVEAFVRDVRLNEFSPVEQAKIQDMLNTYLEKRSHITNGVAASYYGVSQVGQAIHQSKYEGGGDFPDFLVDLTVKAFRQKFSTSHYDLVLYVPPTRSGDLVKNFAVRFASAIGVPVLNGINKTRETDEQKIPQNAEAKKANVKGAFSITANVSEKNIILIDDLYDSGATIKEIASELTRSGAKYVTPVVIAKTVGGTPQ